MMGWVGHGLVVMILGFVWLAGWLAGWVDSVWDVGCWSVGGAVVCYGWIRRGGEGRKGE